MIETRVQFLRGGICLAVNNEVFKGPFKGMKLTDDSVDASMPILLGCYEHELHPAIESAITTPYKRILNIGCSIGYYAVGFAKRMPEVIVDAYDIDFQHQDKCRRLAEHNGVSDRVTIAGEFLPDDFRRYAGIRTLAFVDIEGDEQTLLDPVRSPELLNMDMIVELHDLHDPTLSKRICERFSATHTIELLRNEHFFPDIQGLLPPSVTLDAVDHLILGAEGRLGPTPWGIFRSNRQNTR